MEDNNIEHPFVSDELGRIVLTNQMRETVYRAEHDLEEGRCISESDLKERFAKWL